MPDPDAGRSPAVVRRDFGAAARTYRRRRFGECQRKRRYGTYDAAARVVRAWRLRGDYSIHAYPCDYCRGWHLGH